MNGFFAATSGFPGIYSGLRQKACSRAKPPLVKCLADLRIYKSIPVLRSESQFGAELNGSRPADLVERIQSAESPAEHLCGLSEQRIRNSRIRACEVWVVQNVEGLKSQGCSHAFRNPEVSMEGEVHLRRSECAQRVASERRSRG